jgi:hypothetical protein
LVQGKSGKKDAIAGSSRVECPLRQRRPRDTMKVESLLDSSDRRCRMPRWTPLLPFAGLALACAAGCSTNIERVDPNAPPAAVTSGPAPSASSSPAPEHPAGPAAVLAPPGAAASSPAGGEHEARREQVRVLEAAYQKAPGDTAAKAKLIAAKTEYGVKLMEDTNVAPMMKYRPALKAFNEVLALDPGNKEAAARKTVIEDIYRSMGRPIPQ